MHSESILSAKDLTFTPVGSPSAVLRGISLDIAAGEFVAIMGRSGAGKSTLMYCLSTIERPTTGTVSIAGRNVESASERELCSVRSSIGFVFQQMNLIRHLSILDNVAIAGLIGQGRTNRRVVYEQATELLGLCGLREEISRLPKQLSGGQQQRAAVARALIGCPVILFADEPTGALNSSASHAVLGLFDDVNKRGQTVVMVTHDPRAAARASRVLYIDDGVLAAETRLSNHASLREGELELIEWLKGVGW